MRSSGYLALAALAVAALSGCAKPVVQSAGARAGAVVTVEEEPEWRKVASAADAATLDGLAGSWSTAFAAVTPGDQRELLDPATALDVPTPPPGRYRCRVVRVPDKGRRITAFKPFTCHVGNDGPRLNFTKESGSDRPAGWMWTDGDKRLVFLGTMVRDGERVTPGYGADDARNLAGVVERIGTFRWRLVLPAPVRASRMDVIELVPLVENAGI